MSVLDSSAWIEIFVRGPNGPTFLDEAERTGVVVPTIVLVEVRRWLQAKGRHTELDELTGLMTQSDVVALDVRIALAASVLGIRHRLPLADSVIYATAQTLGLDVWTQDKDFDGLPGVRYLPRPTT